MSFIITVHVREGIVMASDSRLTLNNRIQTNDNVINNIAISQSDSNYKTFLTNNNIGISICGEASIKGVPIAGYIESFINEELADEKIDVKGVSQKLLSYFRSFSPQPNTNFVVAGYKEEEKKKNQELYTVSVKANTMKKVNDNIEYGAYWNGESDIVTRLIKPVWTKDSKTGELLQLPQKDVPFGFFTLQDAIDFAVFAMRTTIDSIRFQTRVKTVGGPIDVLVIKPDRAFWLKRKELSVNNSF